MGRNIGGLLLGLFAPVALAQADVKVVTVVVHQSCGVQIGFPTTLEYPTNPASYGSMSTRSVGNGSNPTPTGPPRITASTVYTISTATSTYTSGGSTYTTTYPVTSAVTVVPTEEYSTVYSTSSATSVYTSGGTTYTTTYPVTTAVSVVPVNPPAYQSTVYSVSTSTSVYTSGGTTYTTQIPVSTPISVVSNPPGYASQTPSGGQAPSNYPGGSQTPASTNPGGVIVSSSAGAPGSYTSSSPLPACSAVATSGTCSSGGTTFAVSSGTRYYGISTRATTTSSNACIALCGADCVAINYFADQTSNNCEILTSVTRAEQAPGVVAADKPAVVSSVYTSYTAPPVASSSGGAPPAYTSQSPPPAGSSSGAVPPVYSSQAASSSGVAPPVYSSQAASSSGVSPPVYSSQAPGAGTSSPAIPVVSSSASLPAASSYVSPPAGNSSPAPPAASTSPAPPAGTSASPEGQSSAVLPPAYSETPSPSEGAPAYSSASEVATPSGNVSPDGRCGGTTGFNCYGAPNGNCCSSYGYCGTGAGYCGTGCQVGAGECDPAYSSVAPGQSSANSATTTTNGLPAGYSSGAPAPYTTQCAPLPTGNLCPAADSTNICDSAGSGYSVRCDTVFSGTRLATTYRKKRQVAGSSAQSCMTGCDADPSCVAVNVSPSGCEYLSSIDGTSGSPGSVALQKNPPASSASSMAVTPSGASTPAASSPGVAPTTFVVGGSTTVSDGSTTVIGGSTVVSSAPPAPTSSALQSSGAGSATGTSPNPAATSQLMITGDGKCGTSNGRTCQYSNYGNCCSRYGNCGRAAAYCCGRECNPLYGSCLSDTDPICVAATAPASTATTSVYVPQPTYPISPDGTCGSLGAYTCKGSRYGDCCSRYGHCGATTAYCCPAQGCLTSFGSCWSSTDPGCAAGVTTSSRPNPVGSTATAAASALPVSPDGTCGVKGPYTCVGSRWGPCCSRYGNCGTTTEYCCPANRCDSSGGLCWSATDAGCLSSTSSAYNPAAATPSTLNTQVSTGAGSSPSASASSLPMSPDGTCGVKGPYTCVGSRWGPCCSRYGNCGTTTEYCCPANRCDSTSGLCWSSTDPGCLAGGSTSSAYNPAATPVAPQGTTSNAVAPSASPSAGSMPISPDGTCGILGAGYTCIGSRYGPCCSRYGHCGTTTEYCCPANRCNTTNGICWSASDPGCQAGVTTSSAYNPGMATLPAAGGSSTASASSGAVASASPSAASLPISPDGTCGVRGPYTCVGSRYGPCCSRYGNCGTTTEYCCPANRCNATNGICWSASDPGCAAGVTTSSAYDPAATPNSPVAGGSSTASGTVSLSTFVSGTSSAGSAASPQSTLPVSPDGTCGVRGPYTCVGSRWGPCCSRYGNCGTTTEYCCPANRCNATSGFCWSSTDPGCQAGGSTSSAYNPLATLSNAPAGGSSSVAGAGSSTVGASQPQSTLPVSPDGRCGVLADYTCIGSSFGPCCSRYGHCGSTTEYCCPSNRCNSTAGAGICWGANDAGCLSGGSTSSSYNRNPPSSSALGTTVLTSTQNPTSTIGSTAFITTTYASVATFYQISTQSGSTYVVTQYQTSYSSSVITTVASTQYQYLSTANGGTTTGYSTVVNTVVGGTQTVQATQYAGTNTVQGGTVTASGQAVTQTLAPATVQASPV